MGEALSTRVSSKPLLEYLGFSHRKICPYWPRTNAEAARFMKAIRAAIVENKPWQRELHKFLLNHRAMPHNSSTNAPAELLFQRKPNTRIPQINCKSNASDEAIRENDTLAKTKMKTYGDKNLHTKPARKDVLTFFFNLSIFLDILVITATDAYPVSLPFLGKRDGCNIPST